MCSLINKQLLLTAYAYLFIMEQQEAGQGSEAMQVTHTGETAKQQDCTMHEDKLKRLCESFCKKRKSEEVIDAVVSALDNLQLLCVERNVVAYLGKGNVVSQRLAALLGMGFGEKKFGSGCDKKPLKPASVYEILRIAEEIAGGEKKNGCKSSAPRQSQPQASQLNAKQQNLRRDFEEATQKGGTTLQSALKGLKFGKTPEQEALLNDWVLVKQAADKNAVVEMLRNEDEVNFEIGDKLWYRPTINDKWILCRVKGTTLDPLTTRVADYTLDCARRGVISCVKNRHFMRHIQAQDNDGKIANPFRNLQGGQNSDTRGTTGHQEGHMMYSGTGATVATTYAGTGATAAATHAGTGATATATKQRAKSPLAQQQQQQQLMTPELIRRLTRAKPQLITRAKEFLESLEKDSKDPTTDPLIDDAQYWTQGAVAEHTGTAAAALIFSMKV